VGQERGVLEINRKVLSELVRPRWGGPGPWGFTKRGGEPGWFKTNKYLGEKNKFFRRKRNGGREINQVAETNPDVHSEKPGAHSV